MDDYLLDGLRRWRGRLEGAPIKQKKNIFLVTAILILCMGLFFYLFFDLDARAESRPNENISLKDMDPMNKIGKGLDPDILKCQMKNSLCDEIKLEKNKDIASEEELRAQKMVAGYPIEKMISYIYEKDKKVAAYILAIGSKESKWGKYAPQKNGRDCYNYWGYKGSYNPTDSGYSCFDTPEQAVKEVGRKIASLIDKKIDTPSKMVVWKCGSSCKGHNPSGVKKWISDVDYYYQKLN
jgi:hypothetical protein